MFDLGKVQNVVEDLQQVLARGLRGTDAAALFGGQPVLGQAAQEAQHPVHRGADLVAHHRQEFRLGAIGGLGVAASGVMGGHFAAQALGLLGDELFQIVAVVEQFAFVLVALMFKVAFRDRLLAEHLGRGFHAGDLVIAAGANPAVEPAIGQRGHVLVKPVERPGDPAAHEEPHDRDRQRQPGHRRGAGAHLGLPHLARDGFAGLHGHVLQLVGHRGGLFGQPDRGVLQILLERLDARARVKNAGLQGKQAVIGGRNRLQRDKIAAGLLKAAGVADRVDPARHDRQLAQESGLDPLQLGRVGGLADAVDEEAHLGRARAEFEHKAKLEEIDLEQLVERLERAAPAAPGVGVAVKAGDHGGGAHLGVGHQGVGHVEKRIRRQKRRGRAFGGRRVCGDAGAHQTVKLAERGAHPRNRVAQGADIRALLRVEPFQATGQGIDLGAQVARQRGAVGLVVHLGQARGDGDDAGAFLGDAAHVVDGRDGLADHVRLTDRKAAQLDQPEHARHRRQAGDQQEGKQQLAAQSHLFQHIALRALS